MFVARLACRRIVALALTCLMLATAGAVRAAELKMDLDRRFVFRLYPADNTQTIHFRLVLLPEESVGAISDGQGYQLVRTKSPGELFLSVDCRYEQAGTVLVGPFTFRVNREEFSAPAFKVVVLPVLAADSGLTITPVLDPNGVGHFVMNIEDHRFLKGRDKKDLVEVDSHKLPKGISVSQPTFYGEDHSSANCWVTNRTGQDFVLTAEYFRNLPEGYDLPRIVVPSTPKQTDAE